MWYHWRYFSINGGELFFAPFAVKFNRRGHKVTAKNAEELLRFTQHNSAVRDRCTLAFRMHNQWIDVELHHFGMIYHHRRHSQNYVHYRIVPFIRLFADWSRGESNASMPSVPLRYFPP